MTNSTTASVYTDQTYIKPLTKILELLSSEPEAVRGLLLQQIKGILDQIPTVTPPPAPADASQIPSTLVSEQSDNELLSPTASSPSLPSSPPRDALVVPPKKRRRLEGTQQARSQSIDIPTGVVVQDDEPSRQTWQARVGITPITGAAACTELASKFKKELQELEFIQKRNNHPVTTRIKEEDIQVIAQFFFDDVFGGSCQDRMFALLDEIRVAQHGEAVCTQAHQKSQDTQLLPEVRDFFFQFGEWHRHTARPTTLGTIRETIRAFDLYQSFHSLREKAAGNEGHELREFLAQAGFTCGIGVDIRSCILRYLSRELRLEAGQLNNILQSQQGIFHLVQCFGLGVLILLPKAAAYRTTRLGSQKIQKIIQICQELLPEGREMSASVEFLVEPIRQAAEIQLPPLLGCEKTRRKELSLLETFTPISQGVVVLEE